MKKLMKILIIALTSLNCIACENKKKAFQELYGYFEDKTILNDSDKEVENPLITWFSDKGEITVVDAYYWKPLDEIYIKYIEGASDIENIAVYDYEGAIKEVTLPIKNSWNSIEYQYKTEILSEQKDEYDIPVYYGEGTKNPDTIKIFRYNPKILSEIINNY